MLHGRRTGKNRMSQYLDCFQSHVLSGPTHKDAIIKLLQPQRDRLGRAGIAEKNRLYVSIAPLDALPMDSLLVGNAGS
jgi:hypothetical protein